MPTRSGIAPECNWDVPILRQLHISPRQTRVTGSAKLRCSIAGDLNGRSGPFAAYGRHGGNQTFAAGARETPTTPKADTRLQLASPLMASVWTRGGSASHALNAGCRWFRETFLVFHQRGPIDPRGTCHFLAAQQFRGVDGLGPDAQHLPWITAPQGAGCAVRQFIPRWRRTSLPARPFSRL